MIHRYGSKLFLLGFTVFMLILFDVFPATAFDPSSLSDIRDSAARLQVMQQVTNDCMDLDIVFVVDQSESMSEGLAPSDPEKQRQFAIQAMIDLLAALAVDQCKGSTYRIAVISFGDQFREDIPFTEIAPSSYTQARAISEELSSRLKADNMGATYPEAALKRALEILQAQSSAETPRKKVVIFLTDGVPCVPGNDPCKVQGGNPKAAIQYIASFVNDKFPFVPQLRDMENCLRELRSQGGISSAQKINKCLSLVPEDRRRDYYSKSIYFYVILIRNAQYIYYRSDMIDRWGAIARDHGGDLIELLPKDKSALPTIMHKILLQLMGLKPTLLSCGKPFVVNPYLKQLRITVYNISTENKVVFSYVDAQGITHRIQNGIGEGFELAEPYQAYGLTEIYSFAYPYPGIWNVSAESCENVSIYALDIGINDLVPFQPNLPARIPAYDVAPFYSPDNPYYIEYQLQVGNRIIKQAPQAIFAINSQITVTQPDGTQYKIRMDYDPENQKLVAVEPLRVPIPGRYSLYIEGTTRWFSPPEGSESSFTVADGQSYEQIFTSSRQLFAYNREFEVFPVQAFLLQGVEPRQDQVVYPVHYSILRGWPLKVAPLPVRVRLVDRRGQPLENAQNVFTDSFEAITAFIKSENGLNSKKVELRPDDRNPGEYIGEIPDFDVRGKQTLVLEIDRSALSETYNPDFYVFEISFERRDFLWTSPAAYRVLFWMIVLGVIVSIAYNFAIRTDKVSGSLIFIDGTEVLAEFGLYSGKNFRIIGEKELQRYPQFGLRKIKVYNIGKKFKKGQDDEISESGLGQGVRVECVRDDGQTFSLDLYPKVPTVYSDIGVGMMIYEPQD